MDHPPPGRAYGGSRPTAPIGWEAAAAQAVGRRPAVHRGASVSGGSSVTDSDDDVDGGGSADGARLPPSLDLDSLSLDEEPSAAGACAGTGGLPPGSATTPASGAFPSLLTPIGCVGGMVLPPSVGGVWSPPAVGGGVAAMFGVRPEAPPFTPGAGAGHPFRL